MKLLIVDDSKLIRERLVETINGEHNIDIIGQVGNSTDAMSYINGYNPDVIILDIRLPGENGIKILEKIKNSKSETIVIMLTNFPYPHYRIKCKELGANYFLNKSSEFELIPEILKSIRKEL